LLNALGPIAVTGTPFILSGTTISPTTSREQPVIVAWSDIISYVNEPSVTLVEPLLLPQDDRLNKGINNADVKNIANFLFKVRHSFRQPI
jgi:hypothetical protein